MSDGIYVLVLALVLSLDAFVCAFAYGSERIKLPMLSVFVITAVCAAVLATAGWVGIWAMTFLPQWLEPVLSFAILFALGVTRLLDGFVKRMIKRRVDFSRQLNFRAFNLRFILQLYADPARADVDSSKTISSGEAVALALAVSLDSVAVGLSAAFAGINMLYLVLAAFVATAAALILGCTIGERISRSLPFDVSTGGGAVLIILAFARLMA